MVFFHGVRVHDAVIQQSWQVTVSSTVGVCNPTVPPAFRSEIAATHTSEGLPYETTVTLWHTSLQPSCFRYFNRAHVVVSTLTGTTNQKPRKSNKSGAVYHSEGICKGRLGMNVNIKRFLQFHPERYIRSPGGQHVCKMGLKNPSERQHPAKFNVYVHQLTVALNRHHSWPSLRLCSCSKPSIVCLEVVQILKCSTRTQRTLGAPR